MMGLWFLHSAIPFIAHYHCIKFHLFIFNTFRDMLQRSLLLQKLEREITLQLVVIELRFMQSALPLRYAPDNLLLQKLEREITL